MNISRRKFHDIQSMIGLIQHMLLSGRWGGGVGGSFFILSSFKILLPITGLASFYHSAHSNTLRLISRRENKSIKHS